MMVPLSVRAAACAAVLALGASPALAVPRCPYVPWLDRRPVPAEAPADPRLMDAAVGAYRVENGNLVNVMTLARDGQGLVARMPGRPDVQLKPIGKAAFAYGDFGDRIVLDADSQGRVNRLIWRRIHMLETHLPRVGASEAAKLTAKYGRRVDAATAAPPSQAVLLRLVKDLQAGDRPDQGRMSVYMDIKLRKSLPRFRSFLSDLGPVTSVRFLGFMGVGIYGVDGEIYDVVQRDGISRWLIAVDDKGVIEDVFAGCGP